MVAAYRADLDCPLSLPSYPNTPKFFFRGAAGPALGWDPQITKNDSAGLVMGHYPSSRNLIADQPGGRRPGIHIGRAMASA